MQAPLYLFPHEVFGKTADLREFLRDQQERARKQLDLSRVPPRFAKLNGIWGEWSADEILSGDSPIKVTRWSDEDQQGLRDLGTRVYVFMGFSTELWDNFNDKRLGLRKGARVLSGGLQQATKHMPQGQPITIPLTESIGFQNITHVVVHYETAEPDLGRKGFQPEVTGVAERLAVAAVTAFKKYYGRLLRKKTGAPSLVKEVRLSEWIDQQKAHAERYPLVIRGAGLFAPTEELPIRSMPLVEQDVVALFNQMLSSGLIRGIRLLASSQYQQYDGLFRIDMSPPFERYIWSQDNPLGVDEEHFVGVEDGLQSPVQVLEYKYSLDALMEEFANEEKAPEDIGLVVAWDAGEKWRERFDALSYLDDDNLHHRPFHGYTHSFSHAVSGVEAFQAIILGDLVSYLTGRRDESLRQRRIYSNDPDME